MTRAEYDVKNERRIDIIMKDGPLTADEKTELEKLQQECMAYVQKVAPVARIQDDPELMAAAEQLGWKPKP